MWARLKCKSLYLRRRLQQLRQRRPLQQRQQRRHQVQLQDVSMTPGPRLPYNPYRGTITLLCGLGAK